MIVQFGKNKIDVDVEKTREYYKKRIRISENCMCDDCWNFEMSTDSFPDNLKDFFSLLGIDPKKINDIWTVGENNNGSAEYVGCAVLCGTVLEGGPAYVKTDKNNFEWNKDSEYVVSDNFYVVFDNGSPMKDENLPEPCCYVDFYAKIPWVLPEHKVKNFSEIDVVDNNEITFRSGEKLLFSSCNFGFKKCIGVINRKEPVNYIEFYEFPEKKRIIFDEKGFFEKFKLKKKIKKIIQKIHQAGYTMMDWN